MSDAPVPAVISTPTLEDLARTYLVPEEQEELKRYLADGGRPLAVETAARFFEMFLAGNTIDDIKNVNKSFPRASINWCRLKYGWDQRKDDCILALQEKTKEKVIRAQLETTSLVSDLLIAASAKHGDSIKRFLMTKNPADLPKELDIDSVTNLLRLSDGLLKLTGQDKIVKVQGNINSTQTTVNENKTTVEIKTPAGMSAKAAAEILKIAADDKRRGIKKDGKK